MAILELLVNHADGRRGLRGRVFTFVCLSVFRTISQKPMQLGSPYLTQKCSTMSPGNPFILGVMKSKVTSHKNIAGVSLYTLVRAGFFR